MALGTPATIRLNPFRSIRQRRRQRQIDDWKRLPSAPAPANCDDLLAAIEINALDNDRDAEYRRIEGHCQVLFDHCEPACGLLGVTVGVDGRLLDHLREPRLGEARRLSLLAPPGSHMRSSRSLSERSTPSSYSTMRSASCSPS